MPAFLLFLYIALVAGLLAWLTIESPPPRRSAPPAEPAAPAETRPVPAPPAPAPAPTVPAPAPATPAPATPPAAAPAPEPEPAPPPSPRAEPPPAATEPAIPEPPPELAPTPLVPPRAEAPSPVEPPPPAAVAPPPEIELPSVAHGPPLSPAPDPALVQDSPRGRLPIIGQDGREAWRVYARPFDTNDKRPRIALVIYGLGISAAATEAAIQGLPGAISLAFSPYADEIATWTAKARAAGHEVLLLAPMEPDNYPVYDPGPQALLTSMDAAQNVERLEWVLGRATGHVGVASYMGTRFTASRRHLAPVLRALKSRGLMYLESRASGAVRELAIRAGVPFAASAFFIDEKASRVSIDGRLEELERLAKQTGRAVAMGYPYPVTLERVAAWARGVEARGFALAPVSALAMRAEPQ